MVYQMQILEDEINLRLLRYLVSGEGISVNIRAISKDLNIHRNTAKSKINKLFENKILTIPFYSFIHLYEVYPLLVLVKADMPRTEEIIGFLKDDSHIFAAFSCMEGPYNTFLIEFFKNLESYQDWREKIVKEQKIPSRQSRSPADAYIFSNKLAFKNDPNCYIKNIRKQYEINNLLEINGYKIDKTSFYILENLMMGKYIQRNDTFLSNELSLNRKTINRKVKKLIDKRIVSEPKCFFPNLFIPPQYNLIVSMVEIKSNKQKIKNFILNNNNISRAQDASMGRYNLLMLSAFKTIEDFFNLGEKLMSKFPDSIGALSNIILSSKTIYTIKPQKLSLAWIERQLWEIKNI